MKNTENAAMPISAMSQRLFFPRRLSGRPEQVSRSADMRSSTVPTPGLNLTRHQLDTVHIHPDSISRTLTKAALPAKMRIAASVDTQTNRGTFLPVSRFHLRNWGGMEPDMNDLDRLRTLARACVQAANEVEDTTTAAMLLESAQRFLNRADPQFALNGDDEEFNRGQ